MSDKTKAYGALILGLIGFFTLGGYTITTTKFDGTIELHRWALTGFFAVMFIGVAIEKFRKGV